MLHVGFEPPRQRVVAADHAVLGDGGDEDDLDHGAPCAASCRKAGPVSRQSCHSFMMSAPCDL